MQQPAAVEPVALGDTDPHRAAHGLRRAELEICWLRETVILGYFIRLAYQEQSPPAAWIIGFCAIAYAALMHWRAQTATGIRITAGAATICDPLCGFALTLATGGILSPFLPAIYFTAITAAFRFGLRAALAVTLQNLALMILLFAIVPGAGREPFGFTLFFVGFAAILGATFAGWARDNLDLVIAQARALSAARDETRRLLHRLISAQEDERQRIAGDLHDQMGGRLFTLQQGLDRCAEGAQDSPALAEDLDRLAQEARRCSHDVRRMMNELRPTVLDELGLFEALQEMFSSLHGSESFVLSTTIDPRLRERRSPQDASLFRIAQEALRNVRKHASAREVSVSLTLDDGSLVLQIQDDGVGFDPAHVPAGHLGLLTMRERAEALGGQFTIESSSGRGTRLAVRLPA